MTELDPEEPLKVPGEGRYLTSRQVQDIHYNSDVDSRPQSQHHTLGPSPNQASPGSHTHDGSNSQRLLGGFSIVGSRGGNAAVSSIIAALVQLGAEDNTTA